MNRVLYLMTKVVNKIFFTSFVDSTTFENVEQIPSSKQDLAIAVIIIMRRKIAGIVCNIMAINLYGVLQMKIVHIFCCSALKLVDPSSTNELIFERSEMLHN